jgi:hypothetical protein
LIFTRYSAVLIAHIRRCGGGFGQGRVWGVRSTVGPDEKKQFKMGLTMLRANLLFLPSFLNEDEQDLRRMIQILLAESNLEAALEGIVAFMPILLDVCASGKADRRKIFITLSIAEEDKFISLLECHDHRLKAKMQRLEARLIHIETPLLG